MSFATFLMQPHPEAALLHIQVFDFHAESRAKAFDVFRQSVSWPKSAKNLYDFKGMGWCTFGAAPSYRMSVPSFAGGVVSGAAVGCLACARSTSVFSKPAPTVGGEMPFAAKSAFMSGFSAAILALSAD
jgi:hypothetical protein